MTIGDDAQTSSESGDSRRTFIKRMAATGALAAPVVSSFAMDGLMSPAAAQASNQSTPPPQPPP